MAEDDSEAVVSSGVRTAGIRAAQVAAGVLCGSINPVLGAIDLDRLRASVQVADDDPDFDAFSTVSSETDHLPFGPAQRHWASSALAAKAEDIAGYERWTLEFAGDAFRNVVTRFGSVA